MSNPFLLTGFSFLAFYLCVGVAVNWGLRVWIRKGETAGLPPQPTLTDSYLIAYLRGGEKEALRIAIVSLADRGLLEVDGKNLKTRNADAVTLANRPIEKAILKRYLVAGDADKIFTASEAVAACRSYHKTLAEHQLVSGPQHYTSRLPLMLAALAILLGVSIVKIVIAFSQGRHNVGFLIVLTIVFCIAVLVAYFKRITGGGEAMMADLRQLFDRLKTRAATLRAGGQTNEAALLAAVFGLTALPVANFPFMDQLYPRKTDGGSGCSSSSSCSSGSSCGGGCGGGGCGG